jgi:hypothetical protein
MQACLANKLGAGSKLADAPKDKYYIYKLWFKYNF